MHDAFCHRFPITRFRTDNVCRWFDQVEGKKGFSQAIEKIGRGDVGRLYQGAYATALGTAVGHLPWFTTFNALNILLRVPTGAFAVLVRNAFIGLAAAFISDAFTNWIRVIKTKKQVKSTSQ